MTKVKGYRIGLRTTLDVDDGKQLSVPYYVVYVEYEDGSVWFETECETLDEAREYITKRTMGNLVEKYVGMIDDELFKATPEETIAFCDGVSSHLKYVVEQANYEKEQYK